MGNEKENERKNEHGSTSSDTTVPTQANDQKATSSGGTGSKMGSSSGTGVVFNALAEKIEHGLQAAYETVSSGLNTDIRLVEHANLPDWSKDNSYLHTGHRYPKESYCMCFRSMMRWHSETGNIWTHLVGAALILGVIVYFIQIPVVRFVAPAEEKAIIILFLISAFFCLLFSTLYHTLAAHSERVLRLFGRLDFSGIAMLIMGSFLPWVYYSFYCSTQSRVVYLLTISLLGIGTIIFSQWDRFAKPEYRVVRAVMFSSLAASGFIPMIHSWIEQGTYIAFTEGQLQWLLLMFLVYGAGALLYATRFPEKLMPGKCDLIVQSHQIFHIFVVFGILIHLYCIMNMQFYRWQRGLNC